jgi:hypothetical protein
VARSNRFSGARVSGGRGPAFSFAGIILIALICAFGALAQAGAGAAPRRISLDGLHVTNGVVTALPDGGLGIETPSSRAVARDAPVSAAEQTTEIRFRYLGPSQSDRPLASGELRRQIGLKLRAADSCNLIYVMWHIAPDTRIAVTVKRNAGHRHAECGARGYAPIMPRTQTTPRPIAPGEVRTLRAELRGRALTVTVDGDVVWQGTLAGEPPAGPPGFRTDNGRFLLEYFGSSPHARMPGDERNASRRVTR